MTWDKLAVELGVNRRQFYQWRQMDGAPAVPSPKAWRAWLANRDGASATTDDDASRDDDDEAGPSIPALKAAKLREEVRKLTLVNDARDKRLKESWRQIGIDTATSILRRARGGLLGLLPDRIASAAAGKDGEAIKLIVRREVESVLDESLKGEAAPA